MKKKISVQRLGELLLYLAILIETVIVIIDKSSLTNPWEGQLFRLTFCLCAAKILLTKYTWKEWFALLGFALLGLISYRCTGRNEIIRIVAFVGACKGMDMKKVLKSLLLITLIGCAAIVLLSVTGVYGAMSLTQDFGRGSQETRYTLGLGHPNALHCMIWALINLAIFLYGTRMKWYHYVALMLLNIGTFALSDSRTSFLILTITLAGGIFIHYCGKWCAKLWFRILALLCYGGSILVSVLAAINAPLVSEYYWSRDFSDKAKFYVLVDKILNGRLHSLADTNRLEGTVSTWSLFSSPSNDYYFDMGWIRLFYWYGIIPALVYLALIAILIIYCIKIKDYYGVLLILSFTVYTIIEAHAISVYICRNYILFLMGMYWTKMLKLDSGRETWLWNIVPFSKQT